MTGDGVPTVLIVEDDPSLRLLCRVNLELENYRVLEAATLPKAKELAGSEHLDVVLLDLHVGEHDGLELLPSLRELCPNAAVCLLSGTSETDPPRMDGVHAFVRKPFDLGELTGTVESLVAREPARP
jgi:two-component system, OmpR family, KDP operon response regulator KdpE